MAGQDAEQSRLAREKLTVEGEPYVSDITRINGQHYIRVDIAEEEYW